MTVARELKALCHIIDLSVYSHMTHKKHPKESCIKFWLHLLPRTAFVVTTMMFAWNLIHCNKGLFKVTRLVYLLPFGNLVLHLISI
jgi:hypothetical protein